MEEKQCVEDELQDIGKLVEAARRMADGDFQELVVIQAKGEIGRLAQYINQTMHNLQQLNPTVEGSREPLPQMSGQLSEVIKATEDASMRVLNEIEAMVEEQGTVDQDLRRLAVLLEADEQCNQKRDTVMQALREIRERHSRTQSRAIEIMSAMEFQDITSQRIQKSITMISEVENRLLRLLVMFHIPTNGANGGDAANQWKTVGEFAAATAAGELDQQMVDRLLAECGQKAH